MQDLRQGSDDLTKANRETNMITVSCTTPDIRIAHISICYYIYGRSVKQVPCLGGDVLSNYSSLH